MSSIIWPIEKASQITNGTLTELLNKIKTEFEKRSNEISGEHLTTLLSWLPNSISDGAGQKITAADANSVLKAIEALSLSYTGTDILESEEDIPEAVTKLSHIQVEIVNNAYNTITKMEASWDDDTIEYAGCEGACQGACLNDCFSTCTERCSAECSNECADSCVKGCGGACSNECTKTCGLVCKNGCSSGCELWCDGSNSMNCNANACEINCHSACYGKCGQYYCESGCAGSCYLSCSATCDDKCVYDCVGSCISSCTGVAGFTIITE